MDREKHGEMLSPCFRTEPSQLLDSNEATSPASGSNVYKSRALLHSRLESPASPPRVHLVSSSAYKHLPRQHLPTMLLATALVVLFLTGASAQRCRWNNCGPPPAPTQAPTTTPPPPALGSTQSMWGQCELP